MVASIILLHSFPVPSLTVDQWCILEGMFNALINRGKNVWERNKSDRAQRNNSGLTSGTVVVTGAAQGFGRAIAETFSRAGWQVGAYDVDVERLEAWVAEWNGELGGGNGVRGAINTGFLDVRDAESWQNTLRDFVAGHGGGINVLINNAGVLYAGDFADQGSFERDAQLVDVNVKGVLFGARAALPYLSAADGGAHLVNLCSASAIYGTPEMATYSATKFAVRGITEALEVEWAARGVLVSSIFPLYANTNMIAKDRTVGMTRLGVHNTPQQVAQKILDVVNGGRSIPAKVHHAVGAQAAVLLQTSHFSPAFLTRYLNGKLVFGGKIRI